MNRWVFRFWTWLNDLLHCAQLWFFSPLWITLCLCKLSFVLNSFWHSSQRCFCFPLWVSMWLLRCPTCPKNFPHCTQLCCFSSQWTEECLERAPTSDNDLGTEFGELSLSMSPLSDTGSVTDSYKRPRWNVDNDLRCRRSIFVFWFHYLWLAWKGKLCDVGLLLMAFVLIDFQWKVDK